MKLEIKVLCKCIYLRNLLSKSYANVCIYKIRSQSPILMYISMKFAIKVMYK